MDQEQVTVWMLSETFPDKYLFYEKVHTANYSWLSVTDPKKTCFTMLKIVKKCFLGTISLAALNLNTLYAIRVFIPWKTIRTSTLLKR